MHQLSPFFCKPPQKIKEEIADYIFYSKGGCMQVPKTYAGS